MLLIMVHAVLITIHAVLVAIHTVLVTIRAVSAAIRAVSITFHTDEGSRGFGICYIIQYTRANLFDNPDKSQLFPRGCNTLQLAAHSSYDGP